MARLTLISRDVTAVDGAPVFEAIGAPGPLRSVVAGFQASVTGTPTTWAVRASIEASFDGGTTWSQVLRFGDITNAATTARVARLPGLATAEELAAPAGTALTSASASGVVKDTPWPALLRAGSMAATLTGGTTPHIIFSVWLESV